MTARIEVQNDEIAEKIDELADLCDVWASWRRLGSVNYANRAAIVMTAQDIAALVRVQGLAMAEWLPIESAPRDGSKFIAWFPACGVDFCHWQWSRHDKMPTGWRDSFISVFEPGSGSAPTHWMPLPEPPR